MKEKGDEFLPLMDGEETAERLNVGRNDKGVRIEINSRMYNISVKDALELVGRIVAAVYVNL